MIRTLTAENIVAEIIAKSLTTLQKD